MPPEPRTDRQLVGRIGALESWARSTDRTARTARAGGVPRAVRRVPRPRSRPQGLLRSPRPEKRRRTSESQEGVVTLEAADLPALKSPNTREAGPHSRPRLDSPLVSVERDAAAKLNRRRRPFRVRTRETVTLNERDIERALDTNRPVDVGEALLVPDTAYFEALLKGHEVPALDRSWRIRRGRRPLLRRLLEGRRMSTYGLRLFDQHQDFLRASCREPGCHKQATSRPTPRPSSSEGFSAAQRRPPTLVIPVWGVTGERAGGRGTYDQPRNLAGKTVKYETHAGQKMLLDVPPRVRQHLGRPRPGRSSSPKDP